MDVKINFDDNALYRHPELEALRDASQEDPREVEASQKQLNYIGLQGSIGCLGLFDLMLVTALYRLLRIYIPNIAGCMQWEKS